MAEINTKFIANPGFGIENVGSQYLTLGVEPTDNGGVPLLYTGWYSMYFDDYQDVLNGTKNGISKVTPTFSEIVNGTTVDDVALLKTFVAKHPMHVSKLNIRCSNAAELPTSIVVKTPNLFTGQWDRQLINVTADTNMYQNQANVVTINCDFYLTRLCVIDFNGGFSTSTKPTLNIDVQIDKYMSLEKALLENLQLMNTATGAAAALAAEVANVNAQVADSGIVVNGSMQAATGTPISAAETARAVRNGGKRVEGDLHPWTSRANR